MSINYIERDLNFTMSKYNCQLKTPWDRPIKQGLTVVNGAPRRREYEGEREKKNNFSNVFSYSSIRS